MGRTDRRCSFSVAASERDEYSERRSSGPASTVLANPVEPTRVIELGRAPTCRSRLGQRNLAGRCSLAPAPLVGRCRWPCCASAPPQRMDCSNTHRHRIDLGGAFDDRLLTVSPRLHLVAPTAYQALTTHARRRCDRAVRSRQNRRRRLTHLGHQVPSTLTRPIRHGKTVARAVCHRHSAGGNNRFTFW